MKKIFTLLLFTFLLTGCVQVEVNAPSTDQPEVVAVEETPESLQQPWTEYSQGLEVPYYRGNSQIMGWIVHVPAYVEDVEPHFHIAGDDILKFPLLYQKHSNFRIYTMDKNNKAQLASDELIAKLSVATESSPVTVTVIEVNAPIEGSPFIVIEAPEIQKSVTEKQWTATNVYPEGSTEDQWEFATFNGKATIHGWFTEVNLFGNMTTLFEISNADVSNLPNRLKDNERQQYYLGLKKGSEYEDLSADQLQKLNNYSNSNPATITVEKVIMRQEGPATLVIQPL